MLVTLLEAILATGQKASNVVPPPCLAVIDWLLTLVTLLIMLMHRVPQLTELQLLINYRRLILNY